MIQQFYHTKNQERYLPIFPVLFISALPAIYLFAQNAFLCPFSEILLPLAISISIGVLCYVALYFLSNKQAFFAAVFGTICMALFLFFSPLVTLTQNIFRTDRSFYAYALAACIAIAVGIPLFLARKKPILRIITAALSVLLSIVLIMNLASAIPGVLKRWNTQADQSIKTPAAEISVIRPNFYYIITDEYAEFDTMRDFFNYDLSAFHDFLTQKGFSVSSESHNKTISTRWNIANNLCLSDDAVDATTDEQTVLESAANGKIFTVLQDLGYTQYALSNIADLFACEPILSFDDLGVTAISVSGKTPTKLLVDQSMLVAISWRIPDNQYTGTAPSAIMDYLSDASNFTFSSNTAIFCYIMSPHSPYSHHADGTLKNRREWYDVYDSGNYLEQHIYTTRRLTEMITTILKEDPDCVIVLQSDHNYRAGSEGGDVPPSGQPLTEREMTRILNAVYFRGQPVDIDGLSGPETLRVVLEKLDN